MIREAAASIKRVWNYEKTINVDIRALQNMLVIFAIVMLLIDVENFKLGKYGIGGATLFAAVVCILCAAVLNRHQKEGYRIGRIAVIVLLALALPIAAGGANDGFSLLWYMLIPIFTLVLFGMPFGVPACIGFGLESCFFSGHRYEGYCSIRIQESICIIIRFFTGGFV